MTRALNSENVNDNEVKSIEVLLFDEKGYTYKPIYSTDIKTDSKDSNIKTFEISVPEGNFDMVVLANSKLYLENALNSFTKGASKAEVMNKLIASNKEVWDLSSLLIPMWGEAKNLVVDNNSSKDVKLDMLRMLAKVNVILGDDAKNNLSLEEVSLFNYNTSGLIAPLAENWTAEEKAVKDVSLPAGVVKESKTPLIYNNDAIERDDRSRGVSLAKEIYMFESQKGTPATHTQNTCLVIGGKFGTSETTTYYRLDFAVKNDGNVDYKNILRNHNYKIAISKVNGPGYPSIEEALKNQAINIEANVIEWDNAEISNVVFDGQYMLGASSTNFVFSREAREEGSLMGDNKLTLATDFPDGWKIVGIVGEDGKTAEWLKASANEGSNQGSKTIDLILTENKTGEDLHAKILVNAGRMNMVINVEHSNASNIGIKIVDVLTAKSLEMLEYPIKLEDVLKPATEKAKPMQMRVQWSPKTTDLYISSSAEQGKEFKFDTSISTSGAQNSIPLSTVVRSSEAPDGFVNYTFLPVAITKADIEQDPFFQRSTTYTFTINDGVKAAVKSLIMKQYVYNAEPILDVVYLLDGGEKSFGVRANTPFTVEVVNDEKKVITLKTAGGAPELSAQGSRIFFDTVDDLNDKQPSIFQAQVDLVIKSTLGVFPDKPVTLKLASGVLMGESNSYMVKPNSLPILIPVSKANGTTEFGKNQLKEGQEFTAELLWTTNSEGLSDNGSVGMVRALGSGPSGYVLVFPGSKQGNSVVAIRDKNTKKIIWSWHIWNTDYDVSKAKKGDIMDRHYGAMKLGVTTNPKATADDWAPYYGLMYQWGRKDPFYIVPTVLRKPADNYKYTYLPIYDAEGKTMSSTNMYVGSPSIDGLSAPKSNLAFTIQNPTRPLFLDYSAFWYINNNQNMVIKWPQGKPKGNEDPCPEGWRVLGLNRGLEFFVYVEGKNYRKDWIRDPNSPEGFFAYTNPNTQVTSYFISQGTFSKIGIQSASVDGFSSLWVASDEVLNSGAAILRESSWSGRLNLDKSYQYVSYAIPLRCEKE